MPQPREQLVSAAVNDRIYAIGGQVLHDDPDPAYYEVLNTVQEYDPTSNTWETKSPMPTARRDAFASAVNGTIYVFGGHAETGYSPSVAVEAYDPVANEWTTRAPMPRINPGAVSCAVNGKIYVIGGAWWPTQVLEYDPATEAWVPKSDMPTGRASLICGVVDGKIYAVGGGQGSNAVGAVEEYDPVADTWESKAPMPTLRKFFAGGVVDGKVYTVGGGDHPDYTLAVVEEYDPVSDSWATKTSMPTGRFYFTASAVNGQLFAIGGMAADGHSEAANEAYTPALDTGEFAAMQYSGTLDLTTTQCVFPNGDPSDPDDAFSLEGSVWASGQAGGIFSAPGEFVITRDNVDFELDLALAGDLDGGALTGTYTNSFVGANGFSSTGSGTFSGTITSSALLIELSGQDTDIFDSTCVVHGTLTLVPEPSAMLLQGTVMLSLMGLAATRKH